MIRAFEAWNICEAIMCTCVQRQDGELHLGKRLHWRNARRDRCLQLENYGICMSRKRTYMPRFLDRWMFMKGTRLAKAISCPYKVLACELRAPLLLLFEDFVRNIWLLTFALDKLAGPGLKTMSESCMYAKFEQVYFSRGNLSLKMIAWQTRWPQVRYLLSRIMVIGQLELMKIMGDINGLPGKGEERSVRQVLSCVVVVRDTWSKNKDAGSREKVMQKPRPSSCPNTCPLIPLN